MYVIALAQFNLVQGQESTLALALVCFRDKLEEMRSQAATPPAPSSLRGMVPRPSLAI